MPPAIPHDSPDDDGIRWLLSHLDGGELGNRLVTYAWLLALSLEHRAAFTNLGFWRYARFFDLNDPLIARPWEPKRAPGKRGFIRRAIEGSVHALRILPPFERWVQNRFSFDGDVVLDTPALTRRALAFASDRLSRAKFGRAVLNRLLNFQHDGVPGRPERALTLATLTGWECPIGDPTVVERHAPAIRAHLRPNAAIREKVQAFLAPLRQRHPVLVGIHIRRGDYKIYRDGRWYFDDPIYAAVMQQFAGLLGGNVGFVVASNHPVLPANFAPLAVTPAPGHLMLDMFSLAGCDFIAGPPSTFSGCASYFGAKPIFWMTDAAARPTDLRELKVWLPQLY